MMKLEYMKREVLNDLKINYSCYEKHYLEADREWFQRYFQTNNGLKDSRIECEDFVLDMNPDYNVSDLKNVAILYSALKNLSVSDASDERLWAGVAHGQLWDYVRYRRKEKIASGNEREVKTSYFYMRGIKRSSYIHCISRLWWAGYLTYDSSRSNPFELTEILCKKAFASNIVIFSSSNLTANKELSLGILSAIKRREDKGENIKREHFVESTKYLNSMGAVTILDFLNRADVEVIIEELFNKKFGVL